MEIISESFQNSQKTQEVNISGLGQQEDPTVKVNYLSEEDIMREASAPTEAAKPDPVINNTGGLVNTDAGSAEFEAWATGLMFIIDYILATILRFWAKDNTFAPYQVPKESRVFLTKSLAVIISKYKATFKEEYVFLFALIAVYTTPFIKARQMRKQNTAPRPYAKRGRPPGSTKDIEPESVDYESVQDTRPEKPSISKMTPASMPPAPVVTTAPKVPHPDKPKRGRGNPGK